MDALIPNSFPAVSGIVADLGLSLAEYAVSGSIFIIGGMLGRVTRGKTANFIGRRRTMWLSEIFCIMGWLTIVFAKVAVYIAEISPKNIRGVLTSTNQAYSAFLSIGIGGLPWGVMSEEHFSYTRQLVVQLSYLLRSCYRRPRGEH